MKKTALQQLIDSWEERKPNGSYGLIWQAFIDEATEFLETEREQIEEAYYDGGDDVCPNGDAGVIKAKEYYKKTYQ